MSLNVLVADDNMSVRLQICLSLEAMGFETDSAENGQQALAKIQQNSSAYDLVLSDVYMPEMDGIELAMEVSNMRRSGKDVPPVVAFSAGRSSSDHQYLAGLFKAHSVPYLRKPIDIERLKSTILTTVGDSPRR